MEATSPSAERVAVLGDGQMGLVMAAVLAGTAAEVRLWSNDPRAAETLHQTRVSPRLPMLALPDRVRVTGEGEAALGGATLALSAVPTQFVRPVWERVRDAMPERVPVVSVAKGIEAETLLRPTQIVAEVLGDHPDRAARAMAVLSGPTIASELARGLPATMIAASDDEHLATLTQQLFTTSYLRIYTGTDPLGVELAGACKNVIAIAAGILDGLKAGFNAKSALLARGLAEITRLGTAMGAAPETFFGLAGAGDLATTCFSPEGRNRSCGEALGRGEALAAYLERTKSVVEGVATAASVMALARRARVEMPISETVHAVLAGELDPIDGIGRLMRRSPKEERIG